MTFDISPDKTLGALQQEFIAAFPGLKLAFFSKPHHAFEGSAAKLLVQDAKLPLGQLAASLQAASIEIGHETPTWQVEEMFEERFGLHVQVFRRSGNLWLETSVTDSLTLAEQQEKARNSDQVHQQFVDPLDYREMD
ncbi:MAG TPA: hypothetical protein PK971_03135 [Saprospiraceae bacterium]|nr:hypothetical protein [Saprospiraceae bacterium]HND87292.1 hypothetical protein [Saprospiraceae bacterium]